mmetsp:Transcript_49966/g.104010  ORF Transcript_49966/g.104010 Transcript_49966/m.104010 type:complete len:245 (+) Transcript_49966:472-1206(+)
MVLFPLGRVPGLLHLLLDALLRVAMAPGIVVEDHGLSCHDLLELFLALLQLLLLGWSLTNRIGFRRRVLLQIHAGLLRFFVNAQLACHLQSEEGKAGKSSGPSDDHQRHNRLCSNSSAADTSHAARVGFADGLAAESIPGMVMVEALPPVKKACCEQPPHAAEAVNWARIHRVVNLQLLEQHRGPLVDEGSDEANGKGAAALHVAARGRDGDEASENAVAQATDIVLLVDAKAEHEDRQATSSR